MPVSRHHHVVALLNDPQSPFELACAAEVFGGVHTEAPARYTFEVCARRPGPLPTTAGYPLLVESGLEALRRADTVVVPGWQPPGGPVPDDVLDALRAAHRRGARTVSICTGAFVLAQAGLLDGRRATTHWRRTGQLAAAFSEVSVAEDVLYVDHGDVATSAGSGAGIDLCLHLVRSDLGSSYAAQVARSMVLPPHRDGSQLQYAPPPTPTGPGTDASLAPVLEWALTRLAADLSVGRLAAYAGLSPAPSPAGSSARSASAPGSGCSSSASTRPGLCWSGPICPSRRSRPGWACRRRSTCGGGSVPLSGRRPGRTAASSAKRGRPDP